MDKMREAFEAWALSEGHPENSFDTAVRGGVTSYYDPTIQSMYGAWIAALASSATTDQPVNGDFKEKLNKLIQACVDLAFDCGEFGAVTPGTVDAYTKIFDASEAADQALRDFVINALAKQVPAQEQDKWINVNGERKPEPNQIILLYTFSLTHGEDDDGNYRANETEEVAMGEYRLITANGTDYQFDCFTFPNGDVDSISHWMPLPPAPAQLAQSADKAEG